MSSENALNLVTSKILLLGKELIIIPLTHEPGSDIFQVIGQHEVAVPTHLYKVIIVEDKNLRPLAYAAFVIPNKPLSYDYKLTDFQIDLRDLEKMAGIRLAPNLDLQHVENLCKHDGCQLIGRTEFELYFIRRKLDSATTSARLKKVWGELAEKKLQPDQYLLDLYEKKKEELKNKEGDDQS